MVCQICQIPETGSKYKHDSDSTDMSDKSDTSDSSYFWLDIKIEISKLCLTVSAKFYHLPVGRQDRNIKGLD